MPDYLVFTGWEGGLRKVGLGGILGITFYGILDNNTCEKIIVKPTRLV